LIAAQDKAGLFWLVDQVSGPKESGWFNLLLKGSKLRLLILVLIIFITGVMFSSNHSRTVILGKQINELNKLLRLENHSLENEIQRLTALDMLDTMARNKLGMVKPDGNNVLLPQSEINQTQ